MTFNLSSTPPVRRGDRVRITHTTQGDPDLREGDEWYADGNYPDGDLVGLYGTSAALVALMGDRWEIVREAR